MLVLKYMKLKKTLSQQTEFSTVFYIKSITKSSVMCVSDFRSSNIRDAYLVKFIIISLMCHGTVVVIFQETHGFHAHFGTINCLRN